jgi:hypothetical protein
LKQTSDEGCAGEGEVMSPCTGYCRLELAGMCSGCHRLLDEIATWGGLSAADKRAVLAAAAARRAASA